MAVIQSGQVVLFRFPQTDLKSESIIRVSRIAIVNENIFSGAIGHIERIKQNLVKWIYPIV